MQVLKVAWKHHRAQNSTFQVIKPRRNSRVSSLKKHFDTTGVTHTWLLQSSADSMIAREASWMTSSGRPTMSSKRRTWGQQSSTWAAVLPQGSAWGGFKNYSYPTNHKNNQEIFANISKWLDQKTKHSGKLQRSEPIQHNRSRPWPFWRIHLCWSVTFLKHKPLWL